MPRLTKLPNNKWAMFGILSLVIIAGFLVYRQFEIKEEKQRFEQARASIDALYTEIVAIAGEPDKTETSESCGYAERKFDRGPRSCNVRTAFVYSLSDEKAANQQYKSVKSGLSESQGYFTITFTNEGERLPLKPYDESFENEIDYSMREVLTSMNCSLSVRYGSSDADWHFINSTAERNSISVSMGCRGDAKAEHYPAINS
jgi:hypothetical protein